MEMVRKWSGSGVELVRRWSGSGAEIVRIWCRDGAEVELRWCGSGVGMVRHDCNTITVWVCGCAGVRMCGCAGVRVCGCQLYIAMHLRTGCGVLGAPGDSNPELDTTLDVSCLLFTESLFLVPAKL